MGLGQILEAYGTSSQYLTSSGTQRLVSFKNFQEIEVDEIWVQRRNYCISNSLS